MRIKTLKLKKLSNLPKRSVYGFLAILILSSSYLWWRPDKVHAQTDTFTTSGTWTVPANVSSAVFEAWGGGGAGGGASNTNTGGGGGAGGQYAKKTLTGLVASNSYTITVGGVTAGGTGNGSVGSDSFVQNPSSSIIALAKGGAGGILNGTGATGSTASGVGDTVFRGGSGYSALNGTYSGGGGGGAGSGGAGGDSTGNGTTDPGGTGTGSNGGVGGDGILAVRSAGNAGSNYGGGGSGGYKTTGSTQSGGAGAQGLVTVTYTPVSYTQSNYQWFANADNTVPGSSLASAGTAATLTSTGQAFRLRQLIQPSSSISAGTNNYDEQYAYLGNYGSCAAIPSGNWGNVGSNPLTPSAALPGGTITGNTGAGIYSWTNTGNLNVNDGSTATVNLHPGTASKDLIATNFGFSIPASATINGISVKFGGTQASVGSSISDTTVELIKSGTVQTGDNQAFVTNWATSAADRTYGSDSYTWLNTWAPSDINSSGFGVMLNLNNFGASAVDAFVDSIAITVYYTAPPASQGPSFAGTGGDDSSIGTGVWSNTGNITADDGSSSTVSVFTSTPSQYLTATNFGFSIPSNATIEGITFSIKESSSNGIATDNAARSIKGGTVQSTDRSNNANLPLSAAYISYGGTSDTWGGVWTPGDVNSSNFGFAISMRSTTTDSVSVDAVEATVYYSSPGAGTISYKDNPTPASGAAISWRSGGVDPTDGAQTITGQTYQEANGFTTTSTVGGTTDGEWDLSMYDNGAAAGSTFCFRSVVSGGAAFAAYSSYPQITTYTPPSNSAPSSPSLTAPSSGATGISATPTFSFSDTDPDSDDIQFKVNLFQSDCSTSVTAYDMAGGQTGWSPVFNGSAGSGLTYTSATAGSGVSFAPSSALSTGTTYCWSVSAKDPGGSNTTTTSSTRLFTTAAAGGSVTVQGGTTIQGGSTIQ